MNAHTNALDSNSSDKSLLDAWLQQRDQSSFEILVERYAPIVHSACLRSWNGDRERADEASQAVFIIFAQKANSIREAAFIGTWLHRCAINTVNTQRRLQARQQKLKQEAQLHVPSITATNSSEENAWQEMRPLLDTGINSLSQKIRESVVLHYYQGQSVKDIADTLSTSESAVKKRLHEGRNRLRAYFSRAGYTVSLAFLSAALQAEISPSCSIHLVATCYQASAPIHIPAANLLAKGVTKVMFISQIKIAATAALLVLGMGAVVGYAADNGTNPNPAIPQVQAETPVPGATPNRPERINPSDIQRSSPIGTLGGAQNGERNGAPAAPQNTGNNNALPNSQGGLNSTANGAVHPNRNNRAAGLQNKVTLQCTDMSIETALGYLSKLSDVTIGLDPKVDKNLTLTLNVADTTLIEVLNSIAKSHKLQCVINDLGNPYLRNALNTAGANAP